MAWTLSDGVTDQSLALWSIERPMLKRISQFKDELTFSIPGDYDATPTFAVGTTLTLKLDAVNWFVGKVRLAQHAAGGNDERINYSVTNVWEDLERQPFQQLWYEIEDPAVPGSPLVQRYRSHLVLNQGPDGLAQDTAEQITEIITYASAQCGLSVAVDTSLPVVNMPFDEQRQLSCAEAIMHQLRLLADAVAWWDYTVSPVKLYIKRGADLATVDVDVTDGAPNQRLSITPRSDMVAAAVVLKYERIDDVDGVPYYRVVGRTAPNPSGYALDSANYIALVGTASKLPGVFLQTVDLQGYSQSHARGSFTVEAIGALSGTEATRIAWWKTVEKWLDNARINVLSVAAGVQSGTGGYTNRVNQGQIADWMGVLSEEVTVTALVSYEVLDAPAGNVIEKRVDQVMSTKVTSTNSAGGTFEQLTGYTSGEDIPVGLETALYNSLSTLFYEGTFLILERECTGTVTVGKKLNITGAKAAWATMASIVQQVTYDIDRGITEITFGPPKQVGIEDLLTQIRMGRYRFNYTAPSTRTTGQKSGGGAVTLGSVVAKESSQSGGGKMEKLVLTDDTTTVTIDVASALTHPVALRPVEICVDGVVKTMIVLCSEEY